MSKKYVTIIAADKFSGVNIRKVFTTNRNALKYAEKLNLKNVKLFRAQIIK